MNAAASQLTEYSTRMCERRTENNTAAIKARLRMVTAFNKRSMDYCFLWRPSNFRMFTNTPNRTWMM